MIDLNFSIYYLITTSLSLLFAPLSQSAWYQVAAMLHCVFHNSFLTFPPAVATPAPPPSTFFL